MTDRTKPESTLVELPPLPHMPRDKAAIVEARERILMTRLAELEADASRYRWLRKRNELTGDVDPLGPYAIEDDDGNTHYPTGAQLDAAIDAAMAKGERP